MNPKHNSTGETDNRKIAQLLTQACDQLDAHTVASLQQARTIALQKQRISVPAFSLASIGHHIHLPRSSNQWLVATLVLATLVFGMADYWYAAQERQYHHNLDIEILTDDLPLEVFLDQ